VWRELLATPETWAKHIFWRVWDEFAGTQHLPPITPHPNSPPFLYSWAKARAALNIDEIDIMLRDGLTGATNRRSQLKRKNTGETES
jgi:hypothetical protein